jgi:class 3 adenylate cyclase
VPEEASADWLRGERQRLEGLAVDAMIRLAEQEFELGHQERPLAVAKRALSIDNLREDAHRLVIRALAALGRRSDALKQYDHFASLLQRELGVEPESATRALVAELRRPESASHWPEPTSGVSLGPHETMLSVTDRSSSASSKRHETTDLKPQCETSADHVPKDEAEKLGADILTGERKHVTVLCTDIKESLEVVTERDPEQALRMSDAILKLMTQAVHRYEETVLLETSDGITAAFGVPAAQEDHAVRACYAALQMQGAVRRYAPELQDSAVVPAMIRAGLNSGEVVVRSIGCGLHAQYRAMGQTMHVAARLQSLAEPNAILISPETHRLLGGLFDYRDLGQHKLKGFAEPLHLHQVLGTSKLKSRFEAMHQVGTSPLLGREEELDLLMRRWEQAKCVRVASSS